MENPCVGICRNRQRHDLRLQRFDAPCLVWFEHSQLLLLGRHLQHVLGVGRPFQDSRPGKTKGKNGFFSILLPVILFCNNLLLDLI